MINNNNNDKILIIKKIIKYFETLHLPKIKVAGILVILKFRAKPL